MAKSHSGRGFEELKSFAKDRAGTNKPGQDFSIKLIELHYWGLCLFTDNSCSMGNICNSPKRKDGPVADEGQLFDSFGSKFCNDVLL